MTTGDILQVILFFVVIIAITPFLGNFMSRVFTGKRHIMMPALGWLEKLTYRFSGVNPEEESNWKEYAIGLLMFNLIGFVFVFLIQLFQAPEGQSSSSGRAYPAWPHDDYCRRSFCSR